jgi:ribose transport system permease protein
MKNQPLSLISGIKNKYLPHLLRYGIYFIFLIMIMIFSFGNNKFLTLPNLLIILQQASPLVIAVIGTTFILTVAGLDISIGQNMYLSATVAGILMQILQPLNIGDTVYGYAIIFITGLLAGSFIGLINGIAITHFRIVPFIATLATMSIARGLSLILSNSAVIHVDRLGFKGINTSVLGIPVVVIIAVALLFIFDYVYRWTPYGMYMKAIGNDRDAAQTIGINVKKIVFLIYLISGSLCGLAGVLIAGQVGAVAVNFAYGNEFLVISAAVLGGTSLFGGKGSVIPGAIIGITMVTMIVNGMTMLSADPYMYQIVRGSIIFLAVMVDSVNYKGDLH